MISDMWACTTTEVLSTEVVGSRFWRDPLLKEQQLPYDAKKADIFSLGMILFTMYTGDSF